jgi:hypothetical protein
MAAKKAVLRTVRHKWRFFLVNWDTSLQ